MLNSNEQYRDMYMPYQKRVNDWIHENTHWKTFMHCCGSIVPLIPSIIDAGFDILNPVQCSAAGMDPQMLKNQFSKDIVFWGGGVNTQQTLPFGTADEVREEVKQRIEIFAEGGGFVFCSIHNVVAEVPLETRTTFFVFKYSSSLFSNSLANSPSFVSHLLAHIFSKYATYFSRGGRSDLVTVITAFQPP